MDGERQIVIVANSAMPDDLAGGPEAVKAFDALTSFAACARALRRVHELCGVCTSSAACD